MDLIHRGREGRGERTSLCMETAMEGPAREHCTGGGGGEQSMLLQRAGSAGLGQHPAAANRHLHRMGRRMPEVGRGITDIIPLHNLVSDDIVTSTESKNWGHKEQGGECSNN